MKLASVSVFILLGLSFAQAQDQSGTGTYNAAKINGAAARVVIAADETMNDISNAAQRGQTEFLSFMNGLSIGARLKTQEISGQTAAMAATLYAQELKKLSDAETEKSNQSKQALRQRENALKNIASLESSLAKHQKANEELKEKANAAMDEFLTAVEKRAEKNKELKDKIQEIRLQREKLKNEKDTGKIAILKSKLNEGIASLSQKTGSFFSGIRTSLLKQEYNNMARLVDNSQVEMDSITNEIADLAKVITNPPIEETVASPDEKSKLAMMNAISNFLTNAEFAKMRADMAMTNFNDIDAALEKQGLKDAKSKDNFADQSDKIIEQYNNTPMGLYVTKQIARAMSGVCELVANQCKDGTSSDLFKFLNDSKSLKQNLQDKLKDQSKSETK